MTLRKQAFPGNEADKLNNHLCATQAAPGVGKSYFCDVIAAHDEQFIQKYTQENSEARKFLESSIGLAVSYNGPTPTIHNGVDTVNPVGGLITRMLWW
jgi:hypothetical protein